MNKRKSLGRGLDALLSSARPQSAPTPAAGAPAVQALVPESALREVPVDLLRRGKYQPRVDMREETLAELAESIKAQGIVQPIVVRPIKGAGGAGETHYEIVAGERRWRAAQLAGLHPRRRQRRRRPRAGSAKCRSICCGAASTSRA